MRNCDSLRDLLWYDRKICFEAVLSHIIWIEWQKSLSLSRSYINSRFQTNLLSEHWSWGEVAPIFSYFLCQWQNEKQLCLWRLCHHTPKTVHTSSINFLLRPSPGLGLHCTFSLHSLRLGENHCPNWLSHWPQSTLALSISHYRVDLNG